MQQVFILDENSTRIKGDDAQRSNISAAIEVANTVRSTLGPKGRDKMLVDETGDVIVTNDGVTILREMKIENPAAKIVVEIAKTQEESVGDGTTTAIIIAGELLKRAQVLLDAGFHPTEIARVYRETETICQGLLGTISKPITINDDELLKRVCGTAITGKSAQSNKELLSDLLLRASKKVFDGKLTEQSIRVIAKEGDSTQNSFLVDGVVLEKEKLGVEMLDRIPDAKIALFSCGLEVKRPGIDTQINITDPQQLEQFIKDEEQKLRAVFSTITKCGANVIFCQKGVDDVFSTVLGQYGLFCVKRVNPHDMNRLSLATGATIVGEMSKISFNHLGNGVVSQKMFGDESFIFVDDCPNPKAVTLFIRGGTKHIAEETKRAVEDALGDLRTALNDGNVVAGAGYPEVYLSNKLTELSLRCNLKERKIIQSFAESLDSIPLVLAENSGLDKVEVMSKLKSGRHRKKYPGLNVFTGEVFDAWIAGVIEPVRVKRQAISSATEVAEMILRIDDVIQTKPLRSSRTPDPTEPMP